VCQLRNKKNNFKQKQKKEMIFNVKTSTTDYNQTDDLDKYKDLGFVFDEYEYEFENYKIKFNILRNTEIVWRIDSIEELIEFSDKFGAIIIKGNNIQIYDSYIE
jgi:hypothetical protein